MVAMATNKKAFALILCLFHSFHYAEKRLKSSEQTNKLLLRKKISILRKVALK